MYKNGLKYQYVGQAVCAYANILHNDQYVRLLEHVH